MSDLFLKKYPIKGAYQCLIHQWWLEEARPSERRLSYLAHGLGLGLAFHTLPARLHAQLHKDSAYLIMNAQQSPSFQRFNLALVLGHLFLEHELPPFSSWPLDVFHAHHGLQKYQREAQRFAMDLLLPPRELRRQKNQYLKQGSNQIIEDLARYFEVPPLLVRLRLSFP